MSVEGAIPAELDGWYLRNGPNPRVASGHWFTGDGMVHGIRIEGGRAAWYRNRWVRTESFEKRVPLYNADGTRNLHAGVANTHVVNHAGKTLALVETSLPYEITNDLKTVGAYDFGGKLVDSMTAHPKICPTTGELHFFGYGNIFAPHVTYHRADANGELTVNRPLDVPALTMMHDFAMTAEHVDLHGSADRVQSRRRHGGQRDMPYRWDDNYGARFGVLRRDDPFGEMRWFDIDPCYVFHVANAYRQRQFHCAAGGSISRTLRGTTAGSTTDGALWSWTINLADGKVTERQLDDRRRGVSAHRRPAGRTAGPLRASRSAVTELVRYDLTTGSAVEHSFGTAESRAARRGRVRAVDDRAGGREQRLVPRLRLRPGPRRQRSGDPRRVRLRRVARGQNPSAATGSVRVPRELDQRLAERAAGER